MSYIGTTEIGKMYLGDVEIGKAYLGDTLVFQGIPVLTFSVNPSSYTGNSLSNASNAYTSETSTSAARATITKVAGGTTSDYYVFNTSSLPQDAVIVSVECKAKAYISSTTNITPRSLCMYTGTTQKGSPKTITGSNQIFTFSGETWTRAELSNVSIRAWATRASGTATSYIFFYGATLTVKYYINE